MYSPQVAILILFFLDAIREMQKYSAEETQQKTVSHFQQMTGYIRMREITHVNLKMLKITRLNLKLTGFNIIECFLGGESPQWTLSWHATLNDAYNSRRQNQKINISLT